MATSYRLGMVGKSCIFQAFSRIETGILQKSPCGLSSSVYYESVRQRRRTCRPPGWFVPRKADQVYRTELTPENREFLSEVAHDMYVGKTPLKEPPFERNPWTVRTSRTGVLAIKIGVLPQWTKDGKKFHTTLLQVLDNHVVRYIPPEQFGKSSGYKKKWTPNYWGSVVVGALSCEPHLFTPQYNNLFAEAGIPPKRKLTRFLVSPDAAVEPGTPLYATHFKIGDYVDVQAKTIGHGFQGVVKRWGFKGGPASHGTTKWHRRPGSISSGRRKAGIWKGKKMPGHMGMDWTTLKGLKVWRINTKYNVLYVTGPCIPGPTHCYVRVMDTNLRYRREALVESQPHMPTFYPSDALEPIPEELFDESLFQFTEESISLEDKTKS